MGRDDAHHSGHWRDDPPTFDDVADAGLVTAIEEAVTMLAGSAAETRAGARRIVSRLAMHAYRQGRGLRGESSGRGDDADE